VIFLGQCVSVQVTDAPNIPIEAKKARPGAHASGQAADVVVRGEEAHRLLKIALQVGFTGIGVQQKGEGRFYPPRRPKYRLAPYRVVILGSPQ
jgi:hypothetical protein